MKREEIFELHDPPPGGLAKLRARMREKRRRPRAAFVLAFAVAALALFVATRRHRPGLLDAARAHVEPAEVELGLASPPAQRVAATERSTVLVEVPTNDPNVSFYWASSTSWTP
jgi:hypothetical protein